MSGDMIQRPADQLRPLLKKLVVTKYIQNMLVACGYDRLETVAKMSIDQRSPGQINDIDNMLSYLNQRYPNDYCYLYNVHIYIYIYI